MGASEPEEPGVRGTWPASVCPDEAAAIPTSDTAGADS